MAIHTAVGMILEEILNNNANKNFIIATDSARAIAAINNNDISVHVNPYIIDIKKRIQDCTELMNDTRKLIFIWVPAHIGVVGNEIADRLAKRASREEVSAEFKIPINDLKAGEFKRVMRARTTRKMETKGRQKSVAYLKNFYDRNANQCCFEDVKADRFVISTVNRLRENHYNLGESRQERLCR